MYIKRNIIFSFIFMLFALMSVVGIYWYSYVRIDYSSIDYIKSLQKGPKVFTDLSGDIGVDSVDDLGFEVKGEYDILIHYGKQIIKVNKQCLMSDEWKNKAEAIGIKVLSRVDKDTNKRLYRITFWGDEVDEWSRVD